MKKKVLGILLALLCAASAGTLAACHKGGGNGGTPPNDQTDHNHVYVESVTPPDCIHRGYTTHSCSCGANYVDTYVAALGHDIHGETCARCGANVADNDLLFQTTADSVTVVGIGTSTRTDIVVPSKVNGKNVIAVGDRAFSSNDNIESVYLPATVKTIGEEAFYDCENLTKIDMQGVEELKRMSLCAPKLASVELPNTLRVIGNSVFLGLCMDKLTVPASVEQIGTGAFAGCDLGAIEVAAGNTHFTSEGNCVFGTVGEGADARKVLLFGCKNSRIPDNGCTEIYDNAFYGVAGVNELVIPDTIEKIGANVFSYSDMRSLKIGAGLQSFGVGVFAGCENLTAITVDPNNATYTAKGNCLIRKSDKAVVLGCKASVIPTDGNVVTKIAGGAFRNCPVPETFDIPDNITEIGNLAFQESNLKRVTVRGNLTKGEGAFAACRALEQVTIADGVTKIPASMFRGTSVRRVILPSSVTEIGEKAFASSALAEIDLKEGWTTIPDGAFSACSSVMQIKIPDSVTEIGEQAFYGCYNLVKLTLGRGVQTIGDDAFYGCYKLAEVVNLSPHVTIAKTDARAVNGAIGAMVKETKSHRNPVFFEGEIYTSTDYESKLDFVDDFVFYNNNGTYELYGTNLIDATLPTGYKGQPYDIATGAFVETDLASLTVTGGVKTFKQQSVFYARQLKEVTLSGVERIDYYVFMNSLVEKISISNCGSLATYAFYYCERLQDLTLHNVKTIEGNLIGSASHNNAAITKVAVTGACDALPTGAFQDIAATDATVILSSEIKKINASAFTSCGFDTVFFTGTKAQWQAMDIDYGETGTDTLRSVEVYCFSITPPTEAGKYWHYGVDGVTPVKY